MWEPSAQPLCLLPDAEEQCNNRKRSGNRRENKNWRGVWRQDNTATHRGYNEKSSEQQFTGLEFIQMSVIPTDYSQMNETLYIIFLESLLFGALLWSTVVSFHRHVSWDTQDLSFFKKLTQESQSHQYTQASVTSHCDYFSLCRMLTYYPFKKE